MNIYKVLFSILTVCYSSNMLHAAPFAYVGNGGANTVSVIDTATNAVIATVNLGTSPNYNGLAITPDNKTVYITCSTSVARIDVATNTHLLPSIALGTAPRSLAISPNGLYAYVTCSDNTVKRINIANNMIDATISGFTSPYEIAITSDSLFAYVSNYGASQIMPINLTNNTLGTPAASSNPWWIALTPNDAYAYVANASTNQVLQFDISNPLTPTQTNAISTGSFTSPQGIVITADGNYAYVTNYDADTVIPINISNPASLILGTPVSVGDSPWVIALTADNTAAYLTNEGDNTVTALNITNRMAPTAFATIAVGDSPAGIAITTLPGLAAPTNALGTLRTNQFLNKTECILIITWTASSEIYDDIVAYNIYRENELIGTVPADDLLCFQTCLRACDCGKIFYVAAVSSDGRISIRIPVILQ